MRRNTAFVAAIATLLLPALCTAQQRGATGGGGTGGTSSLGGSSASSGSSGMFGSRSLGSSLSAGSRGFSGGGSAAAGVQGARPGATQQDTGAGLLQGNERFTRGGRQAGQFVGADTTDLPTALTNFAAGMTGQGGRNGQQQNQRRGGQQANQQGGRTGGGRTGQQQVNYRISRNVGFDYTPPTAAQLRTQLGTRFQSLPGVRALSPIDVTLQERTVVLRGTVATAHDRDLAERLALLEAGVDQVQNELAIAPPASAAPTPTAPAN